MNRKSLFLTLVAIGLIPLGITYGAHPSFNLLPISFLDEVEINSIDHANIFSGIMGLYVTMAIFWILGAFNKSLTIPALWSLVIFMTGIGAGRAISMITDGMPSKPLFIIFITRSDFCTYWIYVYKINKSNSA